MMIIISSLYFETGAVWINYKNYIFFQLRTAFWSSRLDCGPLRQRRTLRHRLLRWRKCGWDKFPICFAGCASCHGFPWKCLGSYEGVILALEIRERGQKTRAARLNLILENFKSPLLVFIDPIQSHIHDHLKCCEKNKKNHYSSEWNKQSSMCVDIIKPWN